MVRGRGGERKKSVTFSPDKPNTIEYDAHKFISQKQRRAGDSTLLFATLKGILKRASAFSKMDFENRKKQEDIRLAAEKAERRRLEEIRKRKIAKDEREARKNIDIYRNRRGVLWRKKYICDGDEIEEDSSAIPLLNFRRDSFQINLCASTLDYLTLPNTSNVTSGDAYYHNIVSIVGPVRSGKSSLLNAIVDRDDDEPFAVGRSDVTSCTRGADLSSKWIDWVSPQAHTEGGDNGDDTRGGAQRARVRFLDSTEAMRSEKSILPILFLSRCVLLNCAFRDNNEDIVDRLETFAQATRRIRRLNEPLLRSSSSPAPPPLWGHLHIILRDVLGTNDCAKHVRRNLFATEPDPPFPDTSTERRNRCRRDILENFESVTIHLFPKKTSSFNDDDGAVKDTAGFGTSLRRLRRVIASQVTCAHRIGGISLLHRGKSTPLAGLVDSVAQSLAGGSCIGDIVRIRDDTAICEIRRRAAVSLNVLGTFAKGASMSVLFDDFETSFAATMKHARGSLCEALRSDLRIDDEDDIQMLARKYFDTKAEAIRTDTVMSRFLSSRFDATRPITRWGFSSV
eukprot:g281.t1